MTSGFLVFASLMRSENLFVFSVARRVPIFSGLLAMLVIVVFWIGPLFSMVTLKECFTHIEMIRYFGINATLLPAIYSDGHDLLPELFTNNAFKNSMNGSLWTLPIELVMYMGLGGMWVFSWVAQRRRSTLLVFTVISMCAELFAFAIFTQITPVKWYGNAAELAYIFFCGSALYIYRNAIRFSHSPVIIPAAVLLVAAGLRSKVFHLAYLIVPPACRLCASNSTNCCSATAWCHRVRHDRDIWCYHLDLGSWLVHLVEKRAMRIGGRKLRESSASPLGVTKV